MKRVVQPLASMPALRWRAAPSLLPNHPLWRWLRDPGSLTARLQARCDRLQVKVLAQGLALATTDERRLLGLRAGERVWLREILLLADERPVVYARSLLPRLALRGAWHFVGRVGSRPLGAALFADPRIRRGPLACHRFDARDARYHRAVVTAGCRQPASLWARRSLFLRGGRPLLVCETFLDAVNALEMP